MTIPLTLAVSRKGRGNACSADSLKFVFLIGLPSKLSIGTCLCFGSELPDEGSRFPICNLRFFICHPEGSMPRPISRRPIKIPIGSPEVGADHGEHHEAADKARKEREGAGSR